VDRLTRKELKTDKFAAEAEHVLESVASHPEQIKRYGAIILAVVVLGGGIYFYRNHQAAAREEALTEAMKIDDGVVSNNPVPLKVTFKTDAEMQAARTKAFTDLMTKYSGTREGAIGGIYMASTAVDKGDMANAEKLFKEVVDSAPSDYSSVAALSLAKVYHAENKTAEAEKLLRDLIKNPTPLVSKEQATIELADVLTKSNPAEARKLLEPLRIGRSAISRAAVAMLGNLPPQGN
jgi:predicted negative regulator of RcsB-dependent stress response